MTNSLFECLFLHKLYLNTYRSNYFQVNAIKNVSEHLISITSIKSCAFQLKSSLYSSFLISRFRTVGVSLTVFYLRGFKATTTHYLEVVGFGYDALWHKLSLFMLLYIMKTLEN